VSRNTVPKIFDFESAFKTTCKESSKWSNERCECSENKDMELNWRNGNRIWNRENFAEGMDERRRNLEFARDKHWIGFTV
jgi:hypothetical protein